MLSHFPRSRWLAAVLATAAVPAFAQEGRPDRDASKTERSVIREKETIRESGETRVQVNRLSTVMNTKVVIQEDQPAGQIVDVVYNDGGCIDYYVADYENQFYVIPYAAAVVRPADHLVFVDIAPAQFREVRFFAENDWPDLWAPQFQQQVFTTFNVDVNNRRSRTTLKQRSDVDIDRRDGDRNRDRDRDRAGDRDRDRDGSDLRDRDRAGDRNERDAADRPLRDRDRDADRPADRNNPPAASERGETPEPPAAREGNTPQPPAAREGNAPKPQTPAAAAKPPRQGAADGQPAAKKPAPKNDPLKGAPEVQPPKTP